MTQPNNRTGYWKRIWEKHSDSMADNLKRLNESRRNKSSERMALLKAVLPMLPIGPMSSTEIRDGVLAAWESTYGEKLTKPAAWNLVRTARDSGVIPKPSEDGTYTVHPLPGE